MTFSRMDAPSLGDFSQFHHPQAGPGQGFWPERVTKQPTWLEVPTTYYRTTGIVLQNYPFLSCRAVRQAWSRLSMQHQRCQRRFSDAGAPGPWRSHVLSMILWVIDSAIKIL
jgi:hypothetical protein